MATIEELLNASRNELLDLSTRNRLLSIPIDSKSARIIPVRDASSERVFQLLVCEKKSLSFQPGRRFADEHHTGETGHHDELEGFGLPQPSDEHEAASGAATRRVETRLQTAFSPEGLQRRLLALYHDSRAMIEEQGVNILYLALGLLKWFEADHADAPRYAPLVLVPVALSRKTASEKFILQWTDDDIEENLSLRAKLKLDFDIEMPRFLDYENPDLPAYFGEVADTLSKA
jgi:hypothetical protein